MDLRLLVERLHEAGYPVASMVPATGGVVALACLATLRDGRRIFAKTLPVARPGLFTVEAEGLRALAELGSAGTPEVLASTPDLLGLAAMQPRGTDAAFWEDAGRMLAGVHLTAVGDKFGWHQDGWLGRLRTIAHDDDGGALAAVREVLAPFRRR